MTSLERHLPSGSGYQIWEPSPTFVEATLTALKQKRQPLESLLVPPSPPKRVAQTVSLDPIEWPSMPTSKPSRVKFDTYKKADDEFVSTDLRADRIPSGLNRLKVTYGSLNRRPHVWGPRSTVPKSSPLPHRTANCRSGQITAAQDSTGLLALAITPSKLSHACGHVALRRYHKPACGAKAQQSPF